LSGVISTTSACLPIWGKLDFPQKGGLIVAVIHYGDYFSAM